MVPLAGGNACSTWIVGGFTIRSQIVRPGRPTVRTHRSRRLGGGCGGTDSGFREFGGVGWFDGVDAVLLPLREEVVVAGDDAGEAGFVEGEVVEDLRVVDV